jgi:hypothetical protein
LEYVTMESVKLKFLTYCIVACLLVASIASPAAAVTVLWKAPNVDITLGMSANKLEFEDPVPANTYVKGYRILEWRDADYIGPGDYEDFDDLTGSGNDGCATEVWMRDSSHSIWTATSVPSNTVSIHLNGDDNDGKAEIRVDGTKYAVLDMGTRGSAQTALVVVKYLPLIGGHSQAPNGHYIVVDDKGWGPSGRGTDVATFGAAALTRNWRLKWWPGFWFLNARIRLVRTPGYITIPTGWWGGWWWWHHQCHWFRPWHGPVWWYKPYCRYWYRHYWDHWPYYRYYRPWWHRWRWRGGRWFWGFKDCLTYRYWHYRPRIIYWWTYYWDPPGQGGALEMVLQANEKDPAGGRVLPFQQPYIPGFDYSGHEFSVHGQDMGSFTPLEFVQINQLESHVGPIFSSDVNDVNDFMTSDIVQRLMENDPSGEGYVGIQYVPGGWDHPEPDLVATTDGGVIPEGAQHQWQVSPSQEPMGTVTVQIVSSEPDELMIDDANDNGTIILPDANGVLELVFDPGNWQQPQIVTVTAVEDTLSEGDQRVMVTQYFSDDPSGPGGVPLEFIIQDNECGGMGYSEADLNADCTVDFHDFAVMGNDWLLSTDPGL